jgi:lysophospholipase L1-like esterase
MRAFMAWAVLAWMAATPAQARPLPPHSSYVAMGSSFAAGPWIGANADTPPNRCGRSAANYAHLLARKLKLELTDASCSGAKANHIVNPWSELPPQIAAVTPQTRLITITAGGNDLNYLGLVGAMACRNRKVDPQQEATADRTACPEVVLPSAEDEARLSETLRTAIIAIHARAPGARIILVQYFNLFAGAPNCLRTGLADAEANTLRNLASHLATLTATAARNSGAEVLPLDTASLNHGVCAASPWVNGNDASRDRADGTFFHPNTAGMAATADLLAKAITARSSPRHTA